MVPRSLRCSDPSSLFGAEDLFFCPGGSAKTAFPFFENYEEVNIVKEALNNILAAAKAELEQAQDAKALEDVRVRYLGKKGELTAILKQNSYKQNVKIMKDKKAYLTRVKELASREPEEVPFREDDRYPGLSRDEIVKYLLMAITL